MMRMVQMAFVSRHTSWQSKFIKHITILVFECISISNEWLTYVIPTSIQNDINFKVIERFSNAEMKK